MDMLFYFIKKSGVEFMNDKIVKLLVDYINDKANSVRKEARNLLVKIQGEIGSSWIEKQLFSKLSSLHKAKSYLQR